MYDDDFYLKFEDENGDIHEVHSSEEFDEAMSHHDWCLVFD